MLDRPMDKSQLHLEVESIQKIRKCNTLNAIRIDQPTNE